MLNKLFGKKKEKDYFLEIEEKDTSEQNKPSETIKEKVKTEETTTVPEVKSETVEKSTKKSTQPTVKKVSSVSSKSVNYDPPEWVKAIKNYTNTDENQTNGLGTKASYLMINAPKPRRRPGPSLNSFKQMANTIKK